jgi:phosphoglycerate dehydrogenase-like enzyme
MTNNYAFVINNKPLVARVFSEEQYAGKLIAGWDDFMDGLILEEPYIFSSWGMPVFTEEQLSRHFPNLKAVFYAAGTVQAFARPFLNKGIRVFSAWVANAVPVAEFTLGQILLANKGFFQLDRHYRQDAAAGEPDRKGWEAAVAYGNSFPGNYGVQVGLLGAGAIGRLVIDMLKPFNMHVKVFDPFMSEEEAEKLGVEKTSMEDIFANCQTISNHLANNAQTQQILHDGLFRSMKENATFINTGRGAQVSVPGLVEALRECPGRTALLDVTDPEEPLPAGHPLWELPNVILTPHRAGSATEEIRRMGAYMFEEYGKLLKGEVPQYEVTLKMLETMA